MSEQQLLELLEAVAAKLGVGVELLWSTLLKQAAIAGVTNTIWAIIFAATAAFCGVFVVKRWNNGSRDELAITVAFFVVVIALFAIPFLTYDAITALANPEFWALRSILDMLVPDGG